MDDKGKTYNGFARSAADLCAFMVVCRHGQLSSAAREMNLSQPSLSQRIRNLEAALDRKLFDRTPKGVSLTADGQAVFQALHEPLSQVARRFDELSENRQKGRLLISVDFAFAYFWLLPRLPKIRQKLGKVDICVLTSQEPRRDAAAGTDLVIQMSDANLPNPQGKLLLQERVSAVCSPEFKANHPELNTVAALRGATKHLLHLNSPASQLRWCTWVEWFGVWGFNGDMMGAETTFNNYELIVQAAVRGQGVALGWHGLIDDLIHTGALTEIIPGTIETKRFYSVAHSKEHPSQLAREVLEWIVEEAGSARPPSSEADQAPGT